MDQSRSKKWLIVFVVLAVDTVRSADTNSRFQVPFLLNASLSHVNRFINRRYLPIKTFGADRIGIDLEQLMPSSLAQAFRHPTSLFNHETGESVDEILHKKDDNFCRTSACVLTASRMDSLIDWKADPCDDFYDFACGRFVKDSTLHDRRDSLNVFSVTDDKLKDQLRRLFTRKIDSDEIKPYQMTKILYKSCINSHVSDARGIEPLRSLIDTIGGWPMLDNWSENGWDLEQSVMQFREAISPNSNKIFRGLNRLGRIHQESLHDSRPDASNAKETFGSAYRSYLIDVAVIAGAQRHTVEMQIDDAIEFQRELIKLNSRRESRVINTEALNVFRNEIYVKYSLTQWLDLFQSLPLQFFAESEKQPALDERSFLNAFDQLLSRTSKQTMANYFIMRIIGFSSQYMTREMKERALFYQMELFGVKQKKEVWKECVDVVSSALELATEAMFSKEYFDLESKELAIEMARRIKRSYENTLLSITWLSVAERAKILLEINKIIAILMFPRERLGDREVNLYYRKVSIEQEKYLESVLKLSILNADRKFLLLQTGINLDAAGGAGNVGVLNSVDVKDFNKILFPAGVLQRDVLSPDRPKYLNYGSSGFIIGYIFSQAFESFEKSRSYPKNVRDAIECFVQQYDNYTDPETMLKNNGKQTLDGNIADIASLKTVFASYKQWLSENGSELRLPAMNFSNAQFFFVAFGQLFCSVTRPEKRKNLNDINPHSIERFRVIGTLSNSLDFARAFNCPNNSPMNPSKKCAPF